MKYVMFFNEDGSDYLVSDWYCGRFLGRIPLVQVESFEEKQIKVGDIQRRHSGHGVYQNWMVVAIDDHSVFLQLQGA